MQKPDQHYPEPVNLVQKFGKAYCPECGQFLGFVHHRGDEVECEEHGEFSARADGELAPFIRSEPNADAESRRPEGQKHGMKKTRS